MTSQQSYLLFVLIIGGILLKFFSSFNASRSESRFRDDAGPKRGPSPNGIPGSERARLSESTVESGSGPGPSRGSASDATARPLRLGGFRFDGSASEILGVSPDATSDEINRAYKDLMKRFHPDKVGLQGSREWKDATSIAEKINRARDELLARRSQSRKG